MKKIIFAFVIFSLILMNSYVFAEGDILGSITVKHIDKDTLEILETEFFDGLEIGEYTLSSIFINNYELDDTVTKTVYLEEREHQEINLKYIKIPEVVELEYDNLVHVIQLDSDGNEISRESRYVDWGATEYFDVKTYYQDSLLHNPSVISREAEGSNWGFKDAIIGDKLRVVNLAREEDKADFTYTLFIQYEKFQPKINVVYWDGYEILDTEEIEYDSLGLKSINTKNFDGYELEEDILEVELEYPNFEKEIWIEYKKLDVPQYDNLVHVSYINQESGEVFFAKSYPAPIGETYQIPIPMFYEDEMIEMVSSDCEWVLYNDYPFEDDFEPIEIDYNDIDENFQSNLKVNIPSSDENKVYSYSIKCLIYYSKVVPQVMVNYLEEDNFLDGEIIEFGSLGEKNIVAKEIKGYEIIGDKAIIVNFSYPDNRPFYFQTVNFEYRKIEEQFSPIPTPIKSKPIQPINPIIKEKSEEKVIVEDVPLTENIPEGEFVSRWEGHKIIEKPIKYSEKEIIKIELSNKLLEKGLQPRFYKWNTQKEKWVALATKINGNTVETYEKVGGYVALFGVKQPWFDDVKGDEWFIEKLDRANGFALIEGIKDGEQLMLNPNRELTRKELYAMVGRIFGAVPKGETSLYNELDYIVEGQDPDWYTPYLHEFYYKGVIDRIFTREQANEKVTRLEALELLTKMLNRVEQMDILDLNIFIDSDSTDIGFVSIVDGFPDGTLKLNNNNINRIEAVTMLVNALEELGW